MEVLYENTLTKVCFLEREGYTVVQMWECEFDKMMNEKHVNYDAEMSRFCNQYEIVEPLQPRDAFYGGRTNAAKLIHECQGDEEIRYSSQ